MVDLSSRLLKTAPMRDIWPAVLAATAAVAIVVVQGPMAAQQGTNRQSDSDFPPELEVRTTVTDGFTVAAVGDMILAYPQSQNPDPQFQRVLDLVRDADVAAGNYEGNIIDGRTFTGSGPGGFAGTPDVADDVKAMGFDIVARSNNHAGEYGYEGLLETNRWLDKAGVVYAGSGEQYASARAARFVSTPKGRVGMVATASSFPSGFMAQPSRGVSRQTKGSTRIPASRPTSPSSRKHRSMQEPTRSLGPVFMSYAESKSTKTGRSSTVSASSFARWMWSGSPAFRAVAAVRIVRRSSTKVSLRSASSKVDSFRRSIFIQLS